MGRMRSGRRLTVSSEMFWKASSMLGQVGSSISSSHTRRDRFSAWRWSSSHSRLCTGKHTVSPHNLLSKSSPE